jgi:ABC-type antimicrobial peptide transport system permease subunit
MMKNKFFIITNVLGLGVAIAICIVSYLAYEYDATFDANHKNRNTVYRVSALREFEKKFTRFGFTPLPLAEIVNKSFQDVDRSSPYVPSNSNFKRNDDLFAASLAYVDPEFFDMFTFEFIAKNGSSLTKSALYISETMAIRLFRTSEEALGKTVTQIYGKESKELRIDGVFRDPVMNSSFYKHYGSAYMHVDEFQDEFKQSLSTAWKSNSTLFLQVNDPTRLTSVHKELQTYTINNNETRDDFQISEFTLDEFSTLAHRDRDEGIEAATSSAPPVSAVLGSVIMSILILLIACFNLTNTAIAISSGRLKEIGVRKVMGSLRIQLILQFIGETTVICFFALAVGMAISDFMVEGWNLMTDNNIHLEPNYFNTRFFVFLTCILFVTGILAGSYPAFYISSFKPGAILKGKAKLGGTNYFTRTLLGLQFTISLIAIVSAIAFMQNASYQKNYDLGFDAQGSIIAWVNDKQEFETYKNALQTYPEIRSIAGAKSGIFSNRLHEPVKYRSSAAEVDIIEVGDNYLKTMDLKLISGRDFITDSETDKRESVIITQKMADLFAWDNPLGKDILWKDSVRLYVVGVVSNVYTNGLWKEMEPMMIRYVGPEQFSQIIVSADVEKVAIVNAIMQLEWANVFPNRLYNGYMLSSAMVAVSALNTSIVYGYAFLGMIAMILSVTGLYALLSLNIIRRMKEIGIRKIVGASVLNITKVLNTEFVIILSFASILGSLASYSWCNIIMSSIWKYYQGLNAWTFLIAITLMFTVSILTIAQKLFGVAKMNPIDTIRNE